MKEVLFIPGKTDYIFSFNSIPKRGKELISAERLNVIKDVEGIISGFPKQVESISGYDNERLVRYNVKAVKNVIADTIDYPLQVAIIEEINLKNEKEIFYVITSNMSLSAEQLRYATHLRWRIENNGFKELNNLYQTKHK